MSQDEVVLILEREGKPLTRKEIESIINGKISRQAISQAIKQLVKYFEIEIIDDYPIPKYSIKKSGKK